MDQAIRTQRSIARPQSSAVAADLIYKALDQETAGNFTCSFRRPCGPRWARKSAGLRLSAGSSTSASTNQRVALRDNWETIEMRASYRRALVSLAATEVDYDAQHHPPRGDVVEAAAELWDFTLSLSLRHSR